MGMARNFIDGLANVITGLGTRADARSARRYYAQQLGPQEIEEAFEASAMLRKAITIPATDRVRAWRDWQADKDQIEQLETEEERHQLQGKVKQAEVLRGLGGGALILIAAGDVAMPLNVTTKGGLVAVNVVSRWHLSGQEWIDNISDPNFGAPKYWQIKGSGTQVRIHPSRVVCFPGEPLPSVWNGSMEDRFWGRGRVPSLLEPAQNLDEALATFAAMIKDALNIDIGVPGLLDMVSSPEGESRILKRLSLMSQGSSVINAKVYDKGDAEGKGGESIDRHQVTWTGIPEVIRVFAEAFSAAAGIPVTRMWETSAKGLNATGEGDDRNWKETIETGQKLETKPCLEQVDRALITSALGTTPDDVWWQFAPLSIPTEKEEADTFKTTMDAVKILDDIAAMPDQARNEIVQNLIIERGWLPGAAEVLGALSDEERWGISTSLAEQEEQEQLAAEAAAEAATAGLEQEQQRRAANDGKPAIEGE